MDAAIFPTMFGLSHIPVSSPPDHRNLFEQAPNSVPAAATFTANPVLFKQFAKEMEGSVAKKAPTLLEKHYQEQQERRNKEKEQQMKPAEIQTLKANQAPLSEQCCTTPSTSASTLASSASTFSSAETKVHIQATPLPAHQPQNTQAHNPSSPTPENPFLKHPGLGLLDASHSSDPKYVQMVARMAAYYQQRCQAILNYQQQRCQTWATSHRQKCQESMQAAMLVVAWYIRDRIGRRRRRNKRSFRRGLREKNHAAAVSKRSGGSGRPTKGETVRKWVMDIPEAALSPNNGMRDDAGLDKEEKEFDVEKEVVPDKDTHLFTVADQMIKSQLAKIDVPLLGALNLEASDSESESEDEEERYYYEPEDYDMEEDDDDDEEDYYDDDMDYDEESEEFVEDVVSKEALDGTGKGSLKRKRSESTSGVE